VATAIAMIGKAFPGWSEEQGDVLRDRFAENGFSDDRMIDSVKHVIDTYEGYGRIPNVANFISFDRKMKLYTYRQMDDCVRSGKASENDFSIAIIDRVSGCRSAEEQEKSGPYWIMKVEARRMKIRTIECKPSTGWPD